MKTRIFIVSVVILSLAFSCQKSENNATTVINGVVIDSLSNKPIKDVFIQLYKEEIGYQLPTAVADYKVVTDTLGVFTLQFEKSKDFLATTDYYILATKDGYANISKEYFYKVDLWKVQNISIKLKKIK